MEREITLSSFAVKNVAGNRPGDFTTRFTPTINLDNDARYYIGFNRIISMFFSWTNANSGYNNQKIAFSKDNGKTWTDHVLILLKEFGLIMILTIILNRRQKQQMVMVMETIQLR